MLAQNIASPPDEASGILRGRLPSPQNGRDFEVRPRHSSQAADGKAILGRLGATRGKSMRLPARPWGIGQAALPSSKNSLGELGMSSRHDSVGAGQQWRV